MLPANSLVVVSASTVDAPAIARIHVASWREAYRGIVPDAVLAGLSTERRETYWRTALAEGVPQVYVARVDDEVVGWIAVGPCRDDGAERDLAELWALYIEPSYWSRGVGRALWQRARQWLIVEGFRVVSLWVLEDNARAIRFYRAVDFHLDPSRVQERVFDGKTLREIRNLADLVSSSNDSSGPGVAGA